MYIEVSNLIIQNSSAKLTYLTLQEQYVVSGHESDGRWLVSSHEVVKVR